MYLGFDQIIDGGPWYAETHVTNQIIVEPWNAFSSLAIAAPAIYFLWKIRASPLKFKFLLFCIPILFLNGIGSTLFHGLRTSNYLLLMDYLPAFALTLSITIYLWYKVLSKWWMVIFTVGPLFILRLIAAEYFSGALGMNLSYIIGGIAFLLPFLLILRKYQYQKSLNVFLAVLCFILAIYFRGADKEFTNIIPFGTHFLWHIFTGIGAYYLADYLYFLRKKELSQQIDQL
ncbi:MAG: hypothetical protein ACI9Z3_000408 [Roseivirga sp.]|jgi:hypothetical protein